jgi:hypothetical protein
MSSPFAPPDAVQTTFANVPHTADNAERARILLALLDTTKPDAALEALTRTAKTLTAGSLSDSASADLPSQETLMQSARALLSRLKEMPDKPRHQVTKPPAQAIIRSTIAALINDSALPREHPAIIAIVLQNQSAATKAAVLRSLPGNTARRVQRALDRIIA